MDVRRLNSTPLAETGSEMPGSVASQQRSPRTSGKLPAIWKTLKAKFGAMSTSRSATNLTSLASTAAQDCGNSLPTRLAVDAYRDRSAHAQFSTSQGLFLSRTSPEGALARQVQVAPIGVTGTQMLTPKYVSGTSSPIEVCHSTNAPMERSGDIFDSAASRQTSTAIAGPTTSPSAAPKTATPSASSSSHPDQYKCSATAGKAELSQAPEAPTPSKGQLLAVSPALPNAMRRAAWALEDYTISRRLFKGTSSAVYKATCNRSGLPVALKVYFLSRVPVNVVHMLKREIEIHSQLVHKNIARLYAAFMDDCDRVVLVQEFAAQGDLYGVTQRMGGRMPAAKVAAAVMRPFLEALSYLHSKGVCHRDIKPENILFTGSWRLLVGDFGVSIDLGRERAVTRAGTEGYMAPEVERCPLKNNPEDNKDDPRYAYSAAVDIWALGVLAYELMVGFPPVVMSTAAAAVGGDGQDATASSSTAGVGGPASPLSGFVRSQMTAASLHFPASVPTAARSFVMAALAADPLERPTAAQLLRHPWLQPQPPAAAAAAEAAAAPVASVSDAAGSPGGAAAAVAAAAALQRCVDLEHLTNSPVPSAMGSAVSSPPGQWALAGGSISASPVLCTPA